VKPADLDDAADEVIEDENMVFEVDDSGHDEDMVFQSDGGSGVKEDDDVSGSHAGEHSPWYPLVVNPEVENRVSLARSDNDDENAPLDTFSSVELSPIQDAASSLIAVEWSTSAEFHGAPDGGGRDDDDDVSGKNVCM
jgi:hypothetical protein